MLVIVQLALPLFLPSLVHDTDGLSTRVEEKFSFRFLAFFPPRSVSFSFSSDRAHGGFPSQLSVIFFHPTCPPPFLPQREGIHTHRQRQRKAFLFFASPSFVAFLSIPHGVVTMCDETRAVLDTQNLTVQKRKKQAEKRSSIYY